MLSVVSWLWGPALYNTMGDVKHISGFLNVYFGAKDVAYEIKIMMPIAVPTPFRFPPGKIPFNNTDVRGVSSLHDTFVMICIPDVWACKK